jgi:hypothetical protein
MNQHVSLLIAIVFSILKTMELGEIKGEGEIRASLFYQTDFGFGSIVIKKSISINE